MWGLKTVCFPWVRTTSALNWESSGWSMSSLAICGIHLADWPLASKVPLRLSFPRSVLVETYPERWGRWTAGDGAGAGEARRGSLDSMLRADMRSLLIFCGLSALSVNGSLILPASKIQPPPAAAQKTCVSFLPLKRNAVVILLWRRMLGRVRLIVERLG